LRSQLTVAAQWTQWLRHAREEPPTIEEQLADVERQKKMKTLARLADERWANKPSLLGKIKGSPSEVEAPKEKASGPSEEWQPTTWQPKKSL
jgi:NADH dehydrogenase [ubiquinone] 1 alpha subcomplex assembly factor 2